jgi:hypothetical protein
VLVAVLPVLPGPAVPQPARSAAVTTVTTVAAALRSAYRRVIPIKTLVRPIGLGVSHGPGVSRAA